MSIGDQCFWPHPAEAPGRVYDLIKQAQFLKVSTDEAEWLFGTQSAGAIARQLPHLQGVLVTAGAEGCHYWIMGNAGTIPWLFSRCRRNDGCRRCLYSWVCPTADAYPESPV